MTQQTTDMTSQLASEATAHQAPAPTDVVQAAEAARAARNGDTAVTWDPDATLCGWRPPLWR